MTGIKLSQLTKQDTITDTALIPITNLDGVSRNISYQNFKANLEKGGVSAKVNSDPSSEVAVVSVQNDNIGLATNSAGVLTLDVSKLPTNIPINSLKYVRTADDLVGALDSSVEYVIDGTIDMGSLSITVPVGGLTIVGFSPDVSTLFSSVANHTMFVSGGSGSGNLTMKDFTITELGANSKVYSLTDSDNSHAIELYGVNYTNCESLGTITGYRQGLEINSGRFGGKPELTLDGVWVGGFRVTTSIVRGLDLGFTGSLFKAGAGFGMFSRFLTDINADLPASCSLTDFSPSNFALPSSIQIQNAFITKTAGVPVTPNLSASDLVCDWRDNIGLNNTYVGGEAVVTSEAETIISAASTFYDVAGTFTTSDLQHFDSPANGQLRHLGDNPTNYKIDGDIIIKGGANDEISLKVVKWDDSASSFVDVITQTRPINNLQSGNDVGFFNIIKSIVLDKNDYVKLQVANTTDTTNVTIANSSFFEISER